MTRTLALKGGKLRIELFSAIPRLLAVTAITSFPAPSGILSPAFLSLRKEIGGFLFTLGSGMLAAPSCVGKKLT
jgi:hypothetical protein